MKRLISILLAVNLSALPHFSLLLTIYPVLAQTVADDLFYTYEGERIPLGLEQTAISVKAAGIRGSNNVSFATELQEYLDQVDLQSRRLKTLVSQAEAKDVDRGYQLQAVGSEYAVVTSNDQFLLETLKEKVRKAPLTERVLPVLIVERTQRQLILPNEILVNFEASLSEGQVQEMLRSQNLEIIRSIAYSSNYFVVQSNSNTLEASLDAGDLSTAAKQILFAANQLRQTSGVAGVTPNFVPIGAANSNDFGEWLRQEGRFLNSPVTNLLNLDRADHASIASATHSSELLSSLLPWQWHLDSLPLLRCLSSKNMNDTCLEQKSPQVQSIFTADINVSGAWQNSNQGRGVVVAVVDSLIQTNHSDLKNNLYIGSNHCPGETSGWDFSSISTASMNPCSRGDTNPAIDAVEVNSLKEHWQITFGTDTQVMQAYPKAVEQLQRESRCSRECSPEKIAGIIRDYIRSRIIDQFHGTHVSGVIAANPDDRSGLMGVAPQAKILPVRAGILNYPKSPVFSPESLVLSIGYAIERGADVINMSLGGDGQTSAFEPFKNRVQQALQDNPNLVIVASSGNSADDPQPILGKVGFPAIFDGVVAVGATNVNRERASYSQYGQGLDVVAPGGDLHNPDPNDFGARIGGILTTGGTFISDFWEGISIPTTRWASSVYDTKGEYIWTSGTSFSSPAVAGVFALMISEDPQRRLSRDQLVDILKHTAGYDRLKPLTSAEKAHYEQAKQQGRTTASSAEEYYFGAGLVNAAAAVAEVKRVVQAQQN